MQLSKDSHTPEMVFSSPVFLFIFLPFVLVTVFLLRKNYRNYFLLLASLFFYAWGEGYLVFIMMISILINYISGLAISFLNNKNHIVSSKIALGSAVTINLLILGYYKYFNFFLENLQSIGLLKSIYNESIQLPIGISFFTFQSISYLIDVFRRETAAQYNPFNLGLYISLFPQLIAGPIVRYHDIAQQISKRTLNNKKFVQGIKRFIIGLGKKVIIANSLALIADETFAIPASEIPTMIAWLGILCYSLQIYFDFSGYSDMAIGLGKMLGFDFLENFNHPYISKSIQEFWRRWHISLSTWFRDYLYIPLGGSRKGTVVTYRNLFIVFIITGFWHGASWNFIVWGLFHGIFLAIEKLGLAKILKRTPKLFQHLYVISIVIIGWVFFRAPDMTYAFSYLQSMLGWSNGGNYYPLIYLDNFRIVTLILGLLFSAPILKAIRIRLMFLPVSLYRIAKPLYKGLAFLFVFAILLFCILELAQNSYNPFIYYRF